MAREGTFLGTLRKTNNNKSTHRVDSGVFSALGPHHPQQASCNVAAPTSTSPSWRPVILIPNITSSPRTTRGWELKPDPAAFAGAHMPWGALRRAGSVGEAEAGDGQSRSGAQT